MKKFFLALALLSTQTLFAFDHSHKAFDQILKDHVNFEGGQSYVNYKAIKQNPTELDSYLKSLSSVAKKDFLNWNAGQRLAFLINAYNAFTIKLIIKHYPVKSIKDIGGIFKSPWKIKFFKLLGEETHLDGIEHDIIRKDFDEPRIHFAVVCASIGCPPLQTFAFTGKEMEKQLKQAAKTFLMDQKKNSFDPKKPKLYLSKIFSWYGDDFNNKYGSFYKYISLHMGQNSKEKEMIASGKTSLKWNSYDWALNEKK